MTQGDLETGGCVLMPSLYREAITLNLLAQGRHDLEVEVFDRLPSTNRYLAELGRRALTVEKTAEKTGSSNVSLPRLCVVDWQTDGSGTRGKPWLSARGNITLSLLEDLSREPGRLLGLSLVTGIAVAQVLESLTGIRIQLKWPNDLIVADAKLGGVLTELLSPFGVSTTRVVTGIGINLRESDVLPPDGLPPIALESLSSTLPTRSQLVGMYRRACTRLRTSVSRAAAGNHLHRAGTGSTT